MTIVRCCLVAVLLLTGCSAWFPPAATAEGPKASLEAEPSAQEPSAPAQTLELSLADQAYEAARLDMVSRQLEARGVIEGPVLEAMRRVPRHLFVPDFYLDQAYDDHPLPIGFGQTISQPYIVGLMTEALQVTSGDRVLEIGTGSGYQAAVLAEMGTKVYTIEIIPELAEAAARLLASQGYENAQVLNADGYFGWPEHQPFDAIIVTAAPDHLPQPLADQLAEGGRLVIPIGPVGAVQSLWLFVKEEGELSATSLGSVRFVPFTRGP